MAGTISLQPRRRGAERAGSPARRRAGTANQEEDAQEDDNEDDVDAGNDADNEVDVDAGNDADNDVVDDPYPWEPDPDDLAAIEEELRAAVERMRTNDDWAGVADESCSRCPYRSICRDSVAPGEPSWPALVTTDHDPTDSR